MSQSAPAQARQVPDHGFRARCSGHCQAPSFPLPIRADSVGRSRGTVKTTHSLTVCCGPASPSSYPHVSTLTYAFSWLHVSYVALAVGSAVVCCWLMPNQAAVFGLLPCAWGTPPAVLLYNSQLGLGLAHRPDASLSRAAPQHPAGPAVRPLSFPALGSPATRGTYQLFWHLRYTCALEGRTGPRIRDFCPSRLAARGTSVTNVRSYCHR